MPEPVDLRDAFDQVAEAWTDIVPPDLDFDEEDLREAVDSDLRVLDQRSEEAIERDDPAVPHDTKKTSRTSPGTSSPAPEHKEPAARVTDALQKAQEHVDALQDLPEWERLQTVRGAASHLWSVLQQQAGKYFERLRSDDRFQGFWRRVSIQACEKIAHWAQAGADRLRRGARRPNAPAADALHSVSEAADAYSRPLRERLASARDNYSEFRVRAKSNRQQFGEEVRSALEPTSQGAGTETEASSRPSGTPKSVTETETLSRTPVSNRTMAAATPAERPKAKWQPYPSRNEAEVTGREVAEAFAIWARTPMAIALRRSTNPVVLNLRNAWQQLPAVDLPNGPGPAAGPYGAVAEYARGVAKRASSEPDSYTKADIAALSQFADRADAHGGRLAATLPHRTPGPTATAAAQAPRQGARARPAAAVPRPAAATPPARPQSSRPRLSA